MINSMLVLENKAKEDFTLKTLSIFTEIFYEKRDDNCSDTVQDLHVLYASSELILYVTESN